MAILLLFPILIPIIFSLIIRFINVKGKTKEILNMCVITLTSLLVIILVLLNISDSLYILHFNDKLKLFLKLDGIGTIFALMVAILWPFAYLYATGYMHGKDSKKNYAMFYVMTFGVVLGIAFSGNLLTLYFFYELLTLVTLPLIMFDNTREAKRAGRFYLYISMFGSTLALIGIIILLHVFQTGDFINVFKVDTSQIYEHNTTYAYVAYLLMFFGFGVKAAIFPFHSWLPKAGVAPTPTTALLHAVAVVKAGAFAIIRMIYSVIGIDVLKNSSVQIISVMFVSFTILFGSMMALKQLHLKRRFAYSTVSNISYILLGATMMSKMGLYAAILHLLFHSFAKIAIFFVAGELLEEVDVVYVDQIDGLAKKMKKTFICYTLAGLSLIGIPLFAGFISKFALINSAVTLNTWYGIVGIVCLLISALLTAIYVFDIIFRAIFKKPTQYNQANFDKSKDGNYKYMIPIFTFSILSLLLGIFANPLFDVIKQMLWEGII
ncbi:MAG: hypothetical protein MR270_01855 [Erysipelotrichaceae bacterium]|nr:hypothetical protein [Erysipelotrichaceae bacterium]